jgi:spermidine/putrescine transport system substrate-binding protein
LTDSGGGGNACLDAAALGRTCGILAALPPGGWSRSIEHRRALMPRGAGQTESERTARAARAFTRRTALRALALGAAAALGPWPVRDALSSSGELTWLTWEDYVPRALLERFTKDTGIRVKAVTAPSNEEQLNRLRASAGGGEFDMCTPTVTWVGAHVDAGVLQPVDLARLPRLGNLMKSFATLAEKGGAVIAGNTFGMPYDWGSEALAFNTQAMSLHYGTASYGDLFDPRWQGRVLCHPRSILLGVGLWMEGRGDLPPDSMWKSYFDREIMAKSYGAALAFCLAHKAQVGTWWTGAAEQMSAFTKEGCVIGQTWDGPINTLKNEGEPVSYLAPKEGALVWCDTLAIPRGARNIEQAHAYMNWSLQPEIGGLIADETGYNPVTSGGAGFARPSYRKNFQEAFPGDALEKLWFQGEEKSWFIAQRQEMAAKLRAG